MSDNILGGRGKCKYCGEHYNNVSYHEGCVCLKRPNQNQEEQWECFCDESYYGMWAVRLPSMKFEETFHLQNKDEAEGLVNLLNRYKVRP